MNEKLLYLQSWFVSKYINLIGNKNAPFSNILIIKLDEIGDLVTSLHVFKNIHKLYPSAKITLFCKSFNNLFFKHIEYVSCVNNEIPKDIDCDLIIDLRGDLSTLKYALKTKPKYRLDRGTIRLKNKFFGGQKNELHTNLQVIEPINTIPKILDNSITLSNQDTKTVDCFIKEENIGDFVIMHLGARDETRRWPVERFAACINYINNTYNLACVLVGGPEDHQLNIDCLELVKSKRNVNVVGLFNLLEFAALCSRARLFLGNESGPLHIASAQNTPLIALFGPGVKEVFYPLGENVKIHHYFLSRGHKHQTMENTTIVNITIDEVKASIDFLLNKKARDRISG